MTKIVYVCERCGIEWSKEVEFCPICYTDLITKEEWNRRHEQENSKKSEVEIVICPSCKIIMLKCCGNGRIYWFCTKCQCTVESTS